MIYLLTHFGSLAIMVNHKFRQFTDFLFQDGNIVALAFFFGIVAQFGIHLVHIIVVCPWFVNGETSAFVKQTCSSKLSWLAHRKLSPIEAQEFVEVDVMVHRVCIDDATFLVTLKVCGQVWVRIEETGSPCQDSLRLALIFAVYDISVWNNSVVGSPNDGVEIFQCWVWKHCRAKMVGQ